MTELMLDQWSEMKTARNPLGIQVMLLHDAVGQQIQAFSGGETQISWKGIGVHSRTVAEAMTTVSTMHGCPCTRVSALLLHLKAFRTAESRFWRHDYRFKVPAPETPWIGDSCVLT